MDYESFYFWHGLCLYHSFNLDYHIPMTDKYFKVQFWIEWNLPTSKGFSLTWIFDLAIAIFKPMYQGRSFGFTLHLLGFEWTAGFWFRTMSNETYMDRWKAEQDAKAKIRNTK